METRETLQQRGHRDQQLKARLRLATTRLADAEQERTWAIVAAHQAGLSIRTIATATGLSRSRVHRLLQDDAAREIPTWLVDLRDGERASEEAMETEPPSLQAVMQARVAEAVEVLRWCIDWLTRLERGEIVVVNLRPDTEDDAEFVRFDHARVRRVLARIAADLDALAHQGPEAGTGRPENSADPRTRHRLAWPSLRKSHGAAPRRNSVTRYGKRMAYHHMPETTPSTFGIQVGQKHERSVQETGRDNVSFGADTARRPKRARLDRRTWFWVGLAVVCMTSGLAQAQGVLGLDPSGRSPRAPPLLLPEEPLREAPQPGPPPLPRLPPLPPLPAEPPEPLPIEGVFVREIRVIGSTVFSPAELAEVTVPYVNRFLTVEDLEALRLALTHHYITRGYVNSGAIIPDQTVTEGVLTLQVIEGELSRIEVEGNRWFRASYFQNRLVLGAGPPLNLNALQERLQLLLQDSRIQRLNTELRPGVQLGESVLDVRVEERNPYKVWLAFNNYQSPTVGAERGLITVAHENLTGYGDILSVQYGRSSGVDLQLDTSYTLPFTARDTTVMLRYRRNTFLVVEAPFEPLDVNSRSEIFGITLRQPLYRTLSQEFALELIGERLTNQTFLLDQPFSFAPGAHRGLSTDTAVRFAPQWVYRTPTQVLAARSQFSVGIDALGATINPSSLPDGRFFAWLGQLQWARRLGLWDAELLWRTDLQLANHPLLPLEQIAVGGRYSVRGYRENQLVRDNGLLASLEARLSVIREHRWAEYLQVAPFIDFGRAWNTRVPTPDPKTLASVGFGLRWAATVPAPFSVRPQFEVYWGVPLNHVKTPGGNLQDWGLHLQLIVALEVISKPSVR